MNSHLLCFAATLLLIVLSSHRVVLVSGFVDNAPQYDRLHHGRGGGSSINRAPARSGMQLTSFTNNQRAGQCTGLSAAPKSDESDDAQNSVRNSDTSSSSSTTKKTYSRELYLREEAESPFRKVRFFLYIALAGGAMTGLAVSGTRVLAALTAGINTDLLPESATNVAVNLGGLVVLAWLFQRDVQAQDSRLKRASKGAELAKLLVRIRAGQDDRATTNDGNDSGTGTSTSSYSTISLSSLRRGRGLEKRVVIAVGGADRMSQALKEAARLQDSLTASDILVVPVLVSGLAPDVSVIADRIPDCVALPVGTNNWKAVVNDEIEEARKQGVDVNQEGFCVILKKNGRIGQRTKGIYLARMVGEVDERRRMGMDVTNI